MFSSSKKKKRKKEIQLKRDGKVVVAGVPLNQDTVDGAILDELAKYREAFTVDQVQYLPVDRLQRLSVARRHSKSTT